MAGPQHHPYPAEWRVEVIESHIEIHKWSLYSNIDAASGEMHELVFPTGETVDLGENAITWDDGAYVYWYSI